MIRLGCSSIQASDGTSNVRLQVQIKPYGTSFSDETTDLYTAASYVASGNDSHVDVSDLAAGQYHWRCRVQLESDSTYSAWTEMGGTPDFSFTIPMRIRAEQIRLNTVFLTAQNDTTNVYDASGVLQASGVIPVSGYLKVTGVAGVRSISVCRNDVSGYAGYWVNDFGSTLKVVGYSITELRIYNASASTVPLGAVRVLYVERS